MRLFGFPVTIRPGFAMFMVMVMVVNGLPLGPWLAGSIAVLTLAHELGHAVAARRAGAIASISLDFLAGYASFSPTRPLTRLDRAAISLAGPAVQIILGSVILIVAGVNPVDHSSFAAEYWSFAIWWAGPVVGFLNLIPVLPLDGGNLAAEAVDVFRPGRGRRIMAGISIPFTCAIIGGTIGDPLYRPFTAFAAVILVFQFQGYRNWHRVTIEAARHAEDHAWLTGHARFSPAPYVMSPYWRAHELVLEGRVDEARDVLVADITGVESPQTTPQTTWWPPEEASREQLTLVVTALPDPLPDPTPSTSLTSAVVLVDVLRRTGHDRAAATWGSRAFHIHRSTPIAIDVARCAVRLERPDVAVQWLEVASRLDDEPQMLVTAILHAPELMSLRGRPEVERILDSADLDR